MFLDVPPEFFYCRRIVRGYLSIYLSICLFVCLSIYLSSTHYAVVDLFSDDLQSLGETETFPLLHCASPCGDSL